MVVLRLKETLWLEQAKEEKESEEKEKSVPREPPPRDTQELQLKASPSQPSEDWPEEEVSRESRHSSMMTPDKSSRDSLKVLSEMPSPTLSTPEEKPLLLWTSFTPSRDKAELSTVSEVDFYNPCISATFFYKIFDNLNNKQTVKILAV